MSGFFDWAIGIAEASEQYALRVCLSRICVNVPLYKTRFATVLYVIHFQYAVAAHAHTNATIREPCVDFRFSASFNPFVCDFVGFLCVPLEYVSASSLHCQTARVVRASANTSPSDRRRLFATSAIIPFDFNQIQNAIGLIYSIFMYLIENQIVYKMCVFM